MTDTTKKRAKRRAKQTLGEFKAWLEGVEELQPPNWAPNLDQWTLIRGRLNAIIEPEPKIIKEMVPQENTNPIYTNPHAPVAPQGFVAPPTPTSFPQDAVVVNGDNMGTTIQAIEPERPATPNIDTRDGNYSSGFE